MKWLSSLTNPKSLGLIRGMFYLSMGAFTLSFMSPMSVAAMPVLVLLAICTISSGLSLVGLMHYREKMTDKIIEEGHKNDFR